MQRVLCIALPCFDIASVLRETYRPFIHQWINYRKHEAWLFVGKLTPCHREFDYTGPNDSRYFMHSIYRHSIAYNLIGNSRTIAAYCANVHACIGRVYCWIRVRSLPIRRIEYVRWITLLLQLFARIAGHENRYIIFVIIYLNSTDYIVVFVLTL